MTEDEAKTKWCPAARIAVAARPSDDLDYASNRPAHDPYNCIASACMAWRTVKFDATTDKIVAIKEHRRVHGSDLLTAKNAVEAAWNPGGPQGFCGLAGAPQ